MGIEGNWEKECLAKRSPDGQHKPAWNTLKAETTDEMGGAQTIDDEVDPETTWLKFGCKYCGQTGTIEEDRLLADESIVDWND